jgi:two-component system chemotaxis response regulator CheB
MPASKIRVLIVDDSASMRQLLTQILVEDPQIEVVGTAPDPYFAREKIISLNPDVLTLDVEMPRMDGVTFLEKIMTKRPMPVVMVSSLTEQGCDVTMRALELGAVDFFTKPTANTLQGIAGAAEAIRDKVKAAARAHVRPYQAGTVRKTPIAASPVTASFRMTHQILAIGASTGGTEAIKDVLCDLPSDAPGVVIVQHMPPGFTASFAKRLDTLSRLNVKEAEDGDRVLPGHALLAPGNFHMELVRNGAEYRVKLNQGPPVNRHRPSVDVLFDSVAAHAGKNAVAAILTGMGNDGARGLLNLRNAGARTVAQDEASCVVFGMPREAILLGGAEVVAPLSKIAGEMLKMAAQPQSQARVA